MRALRRIGRSFIAVAALLSAGCSTDPVAPGEGQIAGSVTIIGDLLPGVDDEGEIFLLRDPDDRRSDALRRAPLHGGPDAYTFQLDGIPRGTYYLEACLRFAAGQGCAPYTRDPGGHPTAVRVLADRLTQVEMRF